MIAKLYIDKGTPLVALHPETLSDGSQAWNLHFRGGETINCLDEKRGDRAFEMIRVGLKEATGQDFLVL